MILNIVVGKPLVEPSDLLAVNKEDWENNEKRQTFFTNNRYLPSILKEAGIVPSTNEVRRNRPELMITLDKMDCFWLKWGKHRVYVVVGE